MIDQLKTEDLIFGGVAFLAGVLVSTLFGSQPAHGGCGHGHGGRPAPALPPGDALLQNAKQIGPTVDGPQTMGAISGPAGNCRRGKHWYTNAYGLPESITYADCPNGNWVKADGGWMLHSEYVSIYG